MKEVLRSKQNIPFTQIANAVLVNQDISLKAKGLFAYIYSKPTSWDFAATRMAKEMKESRDAIETGLKELEDAGYLVRARLSTGKMEYDISFDPMRENPSQGKSLCGKIPHISNKEGGSNKEEEINKETATVPVALGSIDKFFDKSSKGDRPDDGVPMNLQEFVLHCRSSFQRHIRLIGEYADERKGDFNTRGQWRAFGRRNMRAARELTPYTDRHIQKAMDAMKKDLKGDGGFISKWTLETVIKYLDQTS